MVLGPFINWVKQSPRRTDLQRTMLLVPVASDGDPSEHATVRGHIERLTGLDDPRIEFLLYPRVYKTRLSMIHPAKRRRNSILRKTLEDLHKILHYPQTKSVHVFKFRGTSTFFALSEAEMPVASYQTSIPSISCTNCICEISICLVSLVDLFLKQKVSRSLLDFTCAYIVLKVLAHNLSA